MEKEQDSEPFLCKLFGDEGRFVNFVNQTGRPVRLISTLEMRNYANQSWSSRIIIQPYTTHMWRFLGDSPNLSLYFLSLLPDPYKLALNNSYRWTASYIDSADNTDILLGDKVGCLQLTALKELGPGDIETVLIQRHDKGVETLLNLVLDTFSLNEELDEDSIHGFQIPESLKQKMSQQMRDYREITNNRMDPCTRCGEIHI